MGGTLGHTVPRFVERLPYLMEVHSRKDRATVSEKMTAC